MLKYLKVFLILSVFVACFSGTVKAVEWVNVWVVTDGNLQIYKSLPKTVGQFLDDEGLTLTEMDKINYELDKELYQGISIEIERAITVSYSVDGESGKKKVDRGVSVGFFISELEKELNKQLYYDGKLTPIIEDGDRIQLYEIVKSQIKSEQPIPFEVKFVETEELYEGEEQAWQAGAEGILETVVEIDSANGIEIERRSWESVTKEPVHEIKLIGTASKNVVGSSAEEMFEYSHSVVMSATGYTYRTSGVSPKSSHYGKTYTGLPAKRGVVAVDPSVIPLGTRLYIEDYGFAVAADTGGAINGNKIDLCFDEDSEAYSYGRRNVTVYFLME